MENATVQKNVQERWDPNVEVKTGSARHTVIIQ